MKLQSLNLEECQQVRLWRNAALETLRTPYPLTAQMQEDFFRDVVNNRNSPHRYWSIVLSSEVPITGIITTNFNTLVGMAGLTFIEWENRQAEISLIINPKLQGKGYGKKAVHLILDQAFNYMNLELVYGECYFSNLGGIKFWEKIVKRYKGFQGSIRKGKYWNGKSSQSLYFDISKEEFNKVAEK